MTKTITIGPYHPYLLEPSIVQLQVDDGKVADATVTVGFVNRAVEELMATKTFRQDVFLAERICGICSNIHTLAFCQAAEEIMEIAVPPRATHIRTVFVELERLHSHYLSLALLAHAVQDGAADPIGRVGPELDTALRVELLQGNFPLGMLVMGWLARSCVILGATPMHDDEMRAMLIEYMGKGFLENIIALMRQDLSTVRLIPDLVGNDVLMVRLGATALVEELAKDHRQGLAAAVPGLITLLKHENPTLRGDAANVLGIIGSRTAREALLDVQRDSNAAVREIAADALAELDRGDGPAGARAAGQG